MWNRYRFNNEVSITLKKDIIFNLLKNSPKSLTAEEIYKDMSQTTDVNLSTVYRTLNNLVAKGEITKNVRQDKIAYFEIGDQHKHYMICDNCHTAFPTENCEIEKLARKLKRETGFNITSHTLEFHGICPECINKGTNK